MVSRGLVSLTVGELLLLQHIDRRRLPRLAIVCEFLLKR
jgi:hypothetical protein